ncbi:sulfurase [Campylobacter ornithocola]|uniref:Sulfurase n=1 Tax=Campylobacter ornithocola TaxID=1848766 RepID=A0A6M8N1M9_9BACT|nr:MOSC domain-containing protein [Campylobacter ornithocola]OCX43629.1 sulfurase [Campylobacter ornithocola]QKF57484.1 MOSC domain-containing protein [Campylobacter ornithocola]
MSSIKSLQIGKIKNYNTFHSAFIKDIYLNSLQIYVDRILDNEIADKIHHGNLEKVVFANSVQNYTLWNNYLNKYLNFGEMGENLSIEGLDENKVCCGDIHEIGTCILQVSQPRKPCFKISSIHKYSNFTQEIFKSGKTGWYYRVLKEGIINKNEKIKILQKDKTDLSIMELNQLFFNPFENLNSLEKLEKISTLAKGWKESIYARLNHTYDNSYMFI